MEDPPKKFFRLSPGKEVRLKYAYYIKCNEVIKNEKGEITQINCTYDPKTKSGNLSNRRKVKGTIHWVCAEKSAQAEIKIYDRLFSKEYPDQEDNFLDAINPNSLQVISNARIEPSLINPKNINYQFERVGYFKPENKMNDSNAITFIQSVSLRDSWTRIIKQNKNKLTG